MLAFLYLMLLPSELVGINPTPMTAIGTEDQPDVLYKPSGVLLQEDAIYVLDNGHDKLFKFDLQGRLLKTLGGHGQGPGEFLSCVNMIAVDDSIWIADRANGRISIFRNDHYEKQIKTNLAPRNIAIIGDKVWVSDFCSLDVRDGIETYHFDGTPAGSFTLSLSRENWAGNNQATWNSAILCPYNQTKAVMAFTYDTYLGVFDNTGRTVEEHDMGDIYPRYDYRHKSGDIFPAGYAALAFSEGPAGTFLVAACDLETRTCNTLIQLNSSFRGILAKKEMPFSVAGISYSRDLKRIAFVTGDREIFIHQITK